MIKLGLMWNGAIFHLTVIGAPKNIFSIALTWRYLMRLKSLIGTMRVILRKISPISPKIFENIFW